VRMKRAIMREGSSDAEIDDKNHEIHRERLKSWLGRDPSESEVDEMDEANDDDSDPYN
jgi:hypothetical protein